jgi:hypothetical protein
MKLIIALCCVVFLSACSDPKQSIVPSDPAKWDTELKPIIEKLSDEEKKLLGAYLMRSKMGEAFGGEPMLPGTTVADAIQNQKNWQEETEKKAAAEKLLKEQKAAEEKALREKIEQEKAAIKQRIDGTVTVTVLNTYLKKVDYSEMQVFEIAIENKGVKDIVGIKGVVNFVDIFDNKIGHVAFGYDDGLKAGASTTWIGSRDYNQFLDAHKAIARLEKGKYTSRFEPEVIIFSDGEKLTMPE